MGTVRFKKTSKYTHEFADIYLFFEDNRRILLDSDNITELKLDNGRHTVYARENKLYSPVIEFEITEDIQIIEYEVGYNVSGIKVIFDIWYCIANKYDYIYIKKLT